MSDSAALSRQPAADPPAAPSAAAAPPPAPRRRRVRKRFWLLLLVAILASLALFPPPWHAALRALLTWQAAHHGYQLDIDAIEGGPFDTFHLYGLHLRQNSPGTDLRIDHAELTLAWSLPGFQHPAPSWVRQLILDGVRGRWDLAAGKQHRTTPTLTGRFGWNDALAPRLVPANFLLHATDATLARGRYFLRLQGTFLTASYDEAGHFLAQAVEVGGPGFDATLPALHSRAYWQGDRLTLADLDLGHGIRLARATLNGNRIVRRRLDWDGEVRAFGGTIRGQGALDFSRRRLASEVGGTVQQVTLGPLARLMEINEPANGRVQQASFSFRGDPENWAAAEMWLSGRATDFRWGERHWESLEMQVVVTNRRVQVHRLELRQSRNRLSLDGECSLPAAGGRWWQTGFACNVDARLEDLRDLTQLFGPQMPDLTGRMSVNGRLGAAPGTQGYNGYLNVEGSGLRVRGAPLDFLRSTLLFRGEELNVADLQATHGDDYLAGKGSLHIAGPPEFQALARVSVDDLGVYAPAYAGLLPWAEDADAAPIRALTAGVRLEGNVLHLDQCQGEQDGGTFQGTGSVNLRDPAHPTLDLNLTGEQPPRMADPADADAAWRAGVSYTLNLNGPLAANGPAIHGDARLVHGRFDGVWQLDPGAPPALRGSPSLPDALMEPLLRRLPAAWRDWPLDLSVTSTPPLSGGESTVTTDLEITGTGRHPLLGGVLRFQSIPGPDQAGGAWYFSPGQPDNPTVSITAASGEGRRGTFFYGPLAQGRTLSWDLDPAGGELTLQPAEMPPRLVEDTEFSEMWRPVLPAISKRLFNPD